MESYISSEICKQIQSAFSVSKLYKHIYSLMQILPSMKNRTLKLYGNEQPMKQWGSFNNFMLKDWQRDTEALTQPPALASAKQA